MREVSDKRNRTRELTLVPFFVFDIIKNLLTFSNQSHIIVNGRGMAFIVLP